MGTSNLNRGGRPSTEVVVCDDHVSGSTALRGALAQGPCWSRRGGAASTRGPVIPCRTAAAQRHSIAASDCWSHVSSSRDGTATAVLREPPGGLAIVGFVALSRAPSRPSLIQFVQAIGGPLRTMPLRHEVSPDRQGEFQLSILVDGVCLAPRTSHRCVHDERKRPAGNAWQPLRPAGFRYALASVRAAR